MDILSSEVKVKASYALDVLSYQQKLLANNIANVNTDGYRSSYIDFETVMKAYESNFPENKVSEVNYDLSEFTEYKKSTVEVDMELLKMQETVLQYKTLLDALSRRGALMKTVIEGTK